MIKKVFYKNFKNLKDTFLTVESLSILVGSNAAGKSNAIEGFMVLSEVVSGRELKLIFEGTNLGNGVVRGGARGCCHPGYNSFGLGCLLTVDQNTDLRYEIEIITNSKICILEEKLTEISNGKEKNIFKTLGNKDHKEVIIVDCNNGRGKHPQIECSAICAVIAQIANKVQKDTVYGANIEKYARTVTKTLLNTLFLNPNTMLMRSYASINETQLKVDASNVSSVLFNVCKISEKKRILLDVLKKLPENEICDLVFLKGPLEDVMLALIERYGSSMEQIEALRLSDGTLRCLTIMAAILSMDETGIIVIEEIDNGIHPGRARQLIHEISSLAVSFGKDVLVTTHNPTLLNGLSKQEMSGVNIVYRNNENGDGEIVSLLKIEKIPLLLTKGKLGDVFVEDELLKFIKQAPPKYDLSVLGVE